MLKSIPLRARSSSGQSTGLRSRSPSTAAQIRDRLVLARTCQDLFAAGVAAGLSPRASLANVRRCLGPGERVEVRS